MDFLGFVAEKMKPGLVVAKNPGCFVELDSDLAVAKMHFLDAEHLNPVGLN